MQAVIDTNVFISGIFWKGDSHKILDLWLEGRITLITSDELISELVEVLRDFKIRLPERQISSWIDLIYANSIIVMPKTRTTAVVDDSSDNKFLDAALAGNASVIISQDKHLLKLKEFRGMKMMTPSSFLRIYNGFHSKTFK